MKNIYIIILGLFFLKSQSQVNISIKEQLTSDLLAISEQKNIVGFSVAIVNQNKILYSKGFGFSDKLNQKAYTENTIQNIASISKTFIGVSLLKAQELGKLKLDDDINKYLPFEVINPNFPNTPITIRHLATHTSSIIDSYRYTQNGYVLKELENEGKRINANFRSPDEMMGYDEFLKQILNRNGKWYKKKNFLKKKPGTFFNYSNLGAGLAALVLENAVGIPFNLFTKEYIFEPLKMSSSGWFSNEVNYDNHSKLYANTTKELAFYNLINYPDGGLVTSSTDLGAYLIELIAGYNEYGRILKKNSYKELFTPRLNDVIHTNRNTSTYNDEYNIGVFMGMSSQGQIGHTGGDPGVTTLMFFNSKTKIGKIVLINTELDKKGIIELNAIWEKLEEYENKF